MVINVLGLEGMNPEAISDTVLVALLLSKGNTLFDDNADVDFTEVQIGLKENFAIDVVGIKDMYKVMKEQNEKDKEKSLKDMICVLIARSKEDSKYAKLVEAMSAVEEALGEISKTYNGEAETIVDMTKTKYDTINTFIEKKKQLKGE